MRESLLGLPVYEYAALFEKPRTLRRRAASHRPGDALPEARLRRRVGGRDAFFGSTGPTADTVFTGTRYDLHEGLEDGAERRRSSWATRLKRAPRRPRAPCRTARRSRVARDDHLRPVLRPPSDGAGAAADRRCAAPRWAHGPR